MTTPFLNIAVTFALCYAAWGIFFVFLHPRGVNYTSRFLFTTGYFIGATALLALLFWSYLAEVLKAPQLLPLAGLALFMLAQLWWCKNAPHYIQESKTYLEQYPNRDYLSLNWRRLISKSADIANQQVFIILFVLFLNNLGLELYQLIIAFGILFALLHIPLFILEWGKWPMWLFGGAVVVFSLVFPPLILYVPYGFIYNIIIHWLFYTATATSFWFWYAKHL